ncbi:MAG TPA: heme-binding protein [Terriglobales bacterium]|nr:heme-binding protein [Terriglobales bacterium]
MSQTKRRVQLFCKLALGVAMLALLISCGSGGGASTGSAGSDPPPAGPPTEPLLQASEVQAIVQGAVHAVNIPIEVAVTDRLGRILAVYASPGAPTMGHGNFSALQPADELAVALARTGAFFSNDQAPLSSRTVRYISGIHFPPGVAGTENAALYGIENTNRGCSFDVNYISGQDIPPATLINGTSPGLGIITGKADTYDSQPFAVNPGGVPIFENGILVGGIGVVAYDAPTNNDNYDAAEYAAFTGSIASVAGDNNVFGPMVPPPGVVTINGVTLPFVNNTGAPPGITAGPSTLTGTFTVGPVSGTHKTPEGYLVGPNASAYPNGLSANDVNTVVMSAVDTANRTRAAIRLPLGSRARMMISVSDLDGNLLAIYRMHDATIFSIDVSVAKARNVIYFSSTAGQLPGVYADNNPGSIDLPGVPAGTAVTNRTISFGAQPIFPPGIDGTPQGPFFNVYINDTANPCTQGSQPANPHQNGIVFFPGALPLYRNGVMVGGLGVSGDGVDQDDFVTAGGGSEMILNDSSDPSQTGFGFEAPAQIRADQIVIRNVRLPYIKFPRNPTQ